MSRTSCINHPPNSFFVQIHDWQISLMDGDSVAAALLSFFEFNHNSKMAQQRRALHTNRVAEMHGDDPVQDTTLYQWHTEAELEAGIKIAKRATISKSLKKLVDKGFVSIHSNPNPRYSFDKTRYFLFHPGRVNAEIPIFVDHSNLEDGRFKNESPSFKNESPSFKNESPSFKNEGAITYTSSKTSSKTSPENTYRDLDQDLMLISEKIEQAEQPTAPLPLVAESVNEVIDCEWTEKTEQTSDRQSPAPNTQEWKQPEISPLKKLVRVDAEPDKPGHPPINPADYPFWNPLGQNKQPTSHLPLEPHTQPPQQPTAQQPEQKILALTLFPVEQNQPIEPHTALTIKKGSAISSKKGKSAFNEQNFNRFWGMCPMKVGKKRAQTAWMKAANELDIDWLIERLSRLLESHAVRDPSFQYFPRPEAWLNGERWEDEPTDARLNAYVGLSARDIQSKKAWDEFSEMYETARAAGERWAC